MLQVRERAGRRLRLGVETGFRGLGLIGFRG